MMMMSGANHQEGLLRVDELKVEQYQLPRRLAGVEGVVLVELRIMSPQVRIELTNRL